MRRPPIEVRLRAGPIALACALFGHAAPGIGGPDEPPRVNPFACQGQSEVLMSDRSIGQIRWELEKRRDPVFEPGDPPSARALKWCIVAELERRVGDPDASDSYAEAVAAEPDEPGWEMFWGKYYANARGARGPVLELAEAHFYRALEKLATLRRAARLRPEHAAVEDQVRKGLLVLYQEDGLPLLPWKAFPQHSGGELAPGAAVAAQASITRDTRDQVGADELRTFATEAALLDLRSTEPMTARQRFDIVRSPQRLRLDARLRLRQRAFGALDLSFQRFEAKNAQIPNFGAPAAETMVDVTARELGVGYERVVPLYPLFDLSLAGSVKRVHRVGVVEFLPDYAQDFWVYEARPAVSRFLGSDKLTLGVTLVWMDIPPLGPSVAVQEYLKVRGRSIWAATAEYAIYSPLVLPSLHLASLRPYRTPTRGLYLYAGYVNDNEVFGDHRSINETLYGGFRLEGPGPYDIALTEAFYRTSGRIVGETGERDDPTLGGTNLRSTLVLSRRLVNPDASPGVPKRVGPFASDTLNLVFPVSYDVPFSGVLDFENLRAGAQVWWKLFGTGLWGATFLFTASYEYQYFFHVPKHIHNLGVTLRMGWGDL